MLDKQILKHKYGNTEVQCVSADILNKIVPFSNFENHFIFLESTDILEQILNVSCFKLRYEAEIDPSYKQIIPYVIFYNPILKKFYCMSRIDGDERLKGMRSLGVGGHIDNGETFYNALYREIEEEIGLKQNEITSIELKGLIYDPSNEVGSVHLGLVFIAQTNKEDIVCLEKDKLSGKYVTLSELLQVPNENNETWTNIAINECIRGKF